MGCGKEHPAMTNAQKFKEIFGIEIGYGFEKCDLFECQDSSCAECKYHDFWEKEYVERSRRMSKIIQCVVRTGVLQKPYGSFEHNTKVLEEKLKDGYTVVMCNKITRNDHEWLEYILQKEIE